MQAATAGSAAAAATTTTTTTTIVQTAKTVTIWAAVLAAPMGTTIAVAAVSANSARVVTTAP